MNAIKYMVKPIIKRYIIKYTLNFVPYIMERFPRSLLIAERRLGQTPIEGCFNVLRISQTELNIFDYNLNGCRAVLVEKTAGMFYTEAERFCAETAVKVNLPVSRIRLCCSMLSEPGGCHSGLCVRNGN